MTAKCVGCGLDWNVSIYQKIPKQVRDDINCSE